MKRSVKLAAAFAVIGGGLAFLMAGKLKESFRYSATVAEVAAGGDAMVGRPVRVQGHLVAGSILKKREGGKPFFELQLSGQGAVLTLRHDDILPDTLVDGAEVTAEGALLRPGYFKTTKVFAKCPSKYDAAQAPHGDKPPDPWSAAGRSTPPSHGAGKK